MDKQQLRKIIPTQKQIQDYTRKLISEDKQDVKSAQEDFLDSFKKLQYYIAYLISKYGEYDKKTNQTVVDTSVLLQSPNFEDLKQVRSLYKKVQSEANKLDNSKLANNQLKVATATAGISRNDMLSAIIAMLSVEAGTNIKNRLDASLENEFKREVNLAEPISRAVKSTGNFDPNANPRIAQKNNSHDPLNKIEYGMNKRQILKHSDDIFSKDMANNDFDTVYWTNISGVTNGVSNYLKKQIAYRNGITQAVVSSMMWNEIDQSPLDVRRYVHNVDGDIRTQKATVKNRATLAFGIARGIKRWNIITMHDNKVCDYCSAAEANNPYTYTQLVSNGYYPIIHTNDRCDYEPEFDLSLIPVKRVASQND